MALCVCVCVLRQQRLAGGVRDLESMPRNAVHLQM